MPAIVTNPQQSEQMWQALKRHITRERQRKKQAEEADAENERQRKERERQQKQDVMTLGETREQITHLENELSQLKDEKHQLFLQLKKVLNEDDNRRRQLTKEASVCSDVLTAIGNYNTSGTNIVHPQLFLPMPNRSPLYKVTTAVTPNHNLIPNGAIKRSHSPSPPPQSSSYHTVYGYKPNPPMQHYNPPPARELRGDSCIYPESEDIARRSGDSRAVLWNKNNQYPPSTFYSTPGSQNAYSYSGAPTSSREVESAKSVYIQGNRTTLTHQPAYVTNLHTMEHKNTYNEDKYYLRPSSHVTVHGGAIPIQQPPQGAKTGSITSGYPVRAPQPPPGAYPPAGGYVSASTVNIPSRLLYSQPNTRYVQREA